MNKKKWIFFVLLFVTKWAHAERKEDFLFRQVQPALFSVTRIMMHDVVSPPVASRYYYYCTLGAYAIISSQDDTYPHPSRWVQNLDPMTGFQQGGTRVNADLAALFCIYESAQLFVPSGIDNVSVYEKFKSDCLNNGFSNAEVQIAADHAKRTAQAVLSFSQGDGYRFLSTFPRYRPQRKPGFWFPTPPAYMDAIDPQWRTMRTSVIDSPGRFRCAPPIPFDTVPNSRFYSLMKEVYEVKNQLTQEQKEIAAFWDCNPFVVSTSGHMSLGFKKISPGGHWMNIACIAAAKKGIGYRRCIQLVAIEAITLYDAFILCWAEKYQTDRVRPESVINKYMDVTWQPLLQTPPFPEYTSGHSVISSASAEVLSYLLGEEFSYTDDTEVIFDLAPRSYKGFRQAAEEASLSRLYGGIHFRDAIENGQDQGRNIGRYIVDKLRHSSVVPF